MINEIIDRSTLREKRIIKAQHNFNFPSDKSAPSSKLKHEDLIYLELLDGHVLVFVELDALLVQLVHRVHEVLQLVLEHVGRAEVQELRASLHGDLLGELEQQLVDQVRVLDDDGHLLEEVVVGDLEVLDVLRGEVRGLVELHGLLGQPVGLEGEEALGGLASVEDEADGLVDRGLVGEVGLEQLRAEVVAELRALVPAHLEVVDLDLKQEF